MFDLNSPEIESKEKCNKPLITLRPSTIGKSCDLAVYYSTFDFSKSVISKKLNRIFKMGIIWESYILEELKLVGIKITQPEKVKFGLLSGIADGIGECSSLEFSGEPFVIEIKTMNNARFNAMKKGLMTANIQYYIQVQTYMFLYKLKKCLFVYMNKDNCEIRSEVINYHTVFFSSYLKKLSRMVFGEIKPKMIHKEPNYYVCNYCEHKPVCKNGALPVISCKTCNYIEVDADGSIGCTKLGNQLEETKACNLWEQWSLEV